MKTKGNALVILLGGGLVIALALAGYFYLQNQKVQNFLPPPIPAPAPIQPINTDATLKTYSDPDGRFEFQYPAFMKVFVGPQDADQMRVLSYIPMCDENTLVCVNYPQSQFPHSDFQNAAFTINTITGAKNKTQCDKQVADMIPEESKTVSGITFKSGSAGNGALGNQIGTRFFAGFSQNTCWLIGFQTATGNYTKNAPEAGYLPFTELEQNKINQTFEQILESFKFTNKNSDNTTSISTAKKLTYFLPNGWQTIQDPPNHVEIGYDPAVTTGSLDYSSEGVTAVGKWESNPARKLSGNYFAGVSRYDGGSRHVNLYNYIGLTPEEQSSGSWRKSDTHELEYSYSGWPCLVVVGVYISQYPITWGICPVNGTQAIYFTTDTPDTAQIEAFLQTIKFLK